MAHCGRGRSCRHRDGPEGQRSGQLTGTGRDRDSAAGEDRRGDSYLDRQYLTESLTESLSERPGATPIDGRVADG